MRPEESAAPRTAAKESSKIMAIQATGGLSAGRQYRLAQYGDSPLHRVLYAELVTGLFGSLPGAAGLWLRSRLYRPLFASIGRGVIFGRNTTLRHAHKIRIGEGVIVDDNAVLDAKGAANAGITLGDRVYIGRNSIVYCKNGDIVLEDRVNISSSCTLFSSGLLAIGTGTVVAAYSYLLSGGEYDYASPLPFSEQPGKPARETRVGANCWIGAHVTVIDGSRVGEHCVVGAGALVTGSLPPGSLAVGIPARPVKSIGQQGRATPPP
jgi:acetyltransferase-like isoleucine patch superfamily enzyme